MKWALLSLAALILLALPATHLRFIQRGAAKKKREAGFQFLAESYSRGLKPGLPRKTVEDYLKSKGTAFETMWDNRTLTDLVKIGEEDHPWYCSENSVFIRFQFAQAEWGEAALPSGVLTRVDRYDQMRGCL